MKTWETKFWLAVVFLAFLVLAFNAIYCYLLAYSKNEVGNAKRQLIIRAESEQLLANPNLYFWRQTLIGKNLEDYRLCLGLQPYIECSETEGEYWMIDANGNMWLFRIALGIRFIDGPWVKLGTDN